MEKQNISMAPIPILLEETYTTLSNLKDLLDDTRSLLMSLEAKDLLVECGQELKQLKTDLYQTIVTLLEAGGYIRQEYLSLQITNQIGKN